MPRCLRPLTLNRPGLSLSPHSCPSVFWKDSVRPYKSDIVTVPCGKCINCLRNRQDSVVVRCKREAEKRGSFAFVTLTYDDEHIPLSKSLWLISKESGEISLLEPAEILVDASNTLDLSEYRALMKQKKAGSSPRYIDIDFFQGNNPFPDKEVVCRITPSVNRRDVRLWLKRARVRYEREHGFKLPDFSYIAVSEYGPRIRSCRPHYHLAFFGLNRLEVNWLCKQWEFGFTYAKMVPRLNDDNSDAWQAASNYIGKYVSKGKFECESVRDKTSEKPRLCMSMGLGVADLETISDFVHCYDVVGRFDPFTLFRPDGRKLSDSDIAKLVDCVPKRLFYRLSEKRVVALPRFIRNKIFYKVCDYDKTKKTPSRLWYLVASAIRDKFLSDGMREFEEFLSGYDEREISKACAEFAYFQEVSAMAAESSSEQKMFDFYSKSRF